MGAGADGSVRGGGGAGEGGGGGRGGLPSPNRVVLLDGRVFHPEHPANSLMSVKW